MNIAIDVQPIISPGSKNRGIGNYNVNQLKLLIETDVNNNYIFFNAYNDESIFDILNISKEKHLNIKDVHIYTGKNQYLIQKEPHGIRKKYDEILGNIIKNFLSDYKIDIFYFTSPFDYWDIYNPEWFKGVKTIATVYDIIPFLFQKRYLDYNKKIKAWYMRIIEFLNSVDKLLVISESVKEDLIKYIGIKEEKIDVIYAGIDKSFRKLSIISDEKEIREKYGINGKFIMCTGGADPRKNMNELIIAYSMLPQNLRDEYMLAIICSLHKEGEEELRNTAKKHNVSDRVIMTNFVPFDHLVKLYNMATLMAFPSQYEGFGLPVIEAMACGTNVLTSNNSSLGEIAKDAAILVDPFHIKSISKGLKIALEDMDLNKFKDEMFKKVNTYTWENTVRLTIDSINKIKTIRKEIHDNTKRKIAMFTPLPPQKSGIADYSYDMILSLVQYFDIDVYVDDKYKGHPFKSSYNIKIFNYKEYDKKSNQYYKTVFQMGNSEFHEYMFSYIKKYKGILVLHDYNMHGVIHFISGARGDYSLYKKLLAEDNKEVANNYIDEIKQGKCGLKIHEIVANGFVTNYADKIIVHSEYAKKGLLKKDIGKNISVIPSYAKIEPIQDRDKLREKYNLPKDSMIFASFGFIANTKRIDKALEAFHTSLSINANSMYILVGEANADMKALINEFCIKNNIKDKVRITGFTTIDEFKDYINLSDICINLRYPYNGETSGSLMRILAAGKPVIVSDIGSFSEIPDQCCIKIPVSIKEDQEEINVLTESLIKLIKDKKYCQTLSDNARKYAENTLDIEIIAKQYYNFICSEQTNIINETMLEELYKNEIEPLGMEAVEEIYKISKTLGYITKICKKI
ncbi:glycosyltransferase [Anaerophilus nitritogenes]|uniref:glycosyltransferase n=1 Tax=Anaerophilus nitritogenes TaxID=2498136 RepID=UPI00101D6D52|nr:glycosyltransferase [Anaerophilus nitritogenes]